MQVGTLHSVLTLRPMVVARRVLPKAAAAAGKPGQALSVCLEHHLSLSVMRELLPNIGVVGAPTVLATIVVLGVFGTVVAVVALVLSVVAPSTVVAAVAAVAVVEIPVPAVPVFTEVQVAQVVIFLVGVVLNLGVVGGGLVQLA